MWSGRIFSKLQLHKIKKSQLQLQLHKICYNIQLTHKENTKEL